MRKYRIVLLLVCMMALLAGCASNNVADVNGEKITREELDKVVQSYVANFQYLYQKAIDPQKDSKLYKEIERTALNDLIKEKVQMQQANEEGMTASQQEITEASESFQEMTGGKQGFEAFLKQAGTDEAGFKAEMKKQVLIRKLNERVTKDVKVSDKEILRYYKEHPADFGNPREVKVSHILVKTKSEAEEIIRQLNNGWDMEKLARKQSIDPTVQQNGGNLGFVSESSQLIDSFKDAAMKLHVGEVTQKPVKTQYGYHVIKAFAVKTEKVEAFETVKKQAADKALQSKKDVVWNHYVENLVRKAKVKITLD